MASFSDDEIRVARNVVAVARAFRRQGGSIPDLLHLAVTRQESGWNDSAENAADPQGSFGPYQINQAVFPGTVALATSPWANYAYHIVNERWERTFNGPNLAGHWGEVQNRAAFIEQFAPAAQGSVDWGVGMGSVRYLEALEMLEIVS